MFMHPKLKTIAKLQKAAASLMSHMTLHLDHVDDAEIDEIVNMMREVEDSMRERRNAPGAAR